MGAKRKTPSRSTSAPSRRRRPGDPVLAYAKDAVAGRLIVGQLVRAACERHLRDLVEGPKRGLTWNRDLARRAIGFFPDVLQLNGGNFEGKPFILEPWEEFIVGSLFGWVGPDGYRRFRLAYLEIGKGSGKSPLGAGIGHYMLLADDEPRAECYVAATKKDQAMIPFRDAVAMVDQSPALSRRIKKSGGAGQVWNLAHLPTGSFFRPIASDDSQSGPRPHYALIDEIHEHKDSTVIDLMRAGTKGRRQALILEITNSGQDRMSVCYRHRQYSEQILDGVIENDAWFAYVCTLDPCPTCRAEGHRQPNEGCADCDDWRDPAVWLKVNPNLGVSITRKYLEELVVEAEGMPVKQNIVKRLNFCLWTQNIEKAIPIELWDRGAAAIDLASLAGRPCFGGMDLGRVSDLSALALLFPPADPGECWKVLVRFWVPAEDVHRRSLRGVPYDQWVREGLLSVTPGNVTDFAFIEHEILDLASRYEIRRLAFDRTFAGEIVQNLQAEGLVMVEFGQGFLSMAAPTAELLRLVKGGELQHGGHPVLRWNASNLTLRLDPAGNMKPDKEKSPEKIDGIVALLDALGIALKAPAEEVGVGVSFLESETDADDASPEVDVEDPTAFEEWDPWL